MAGVAGTACHLAVAVRYTRKVCIGDRQALFATTGSGPLTRRSVPGGGSLFMIIGGVVSCLFEIKWKGHDSLW